MVETLEQPLAATEHHWRDRHDQLVQVTTGQRLADAAVSAAQAVGAGVVADYSQIGVLVVSATEAQAANLQQAKVGDVASTEGLGSLLDEDDSLEMVATVAAGALGSVAADAESEPLWACNGTCRRLAWSTRTR